MVCILKLWEDMQRILEMLMFKRFYFFLILDMNPTRVIPILGQWKMLQVPDFDTILKQQGENR